MTSQPDMLKPVPDKAPADDLFDWRQVSHSRSFILLGLGAVLGLVLAGFALFTAKGAASHSLPAEDVALVNNQPILKADFVSQVEAAYGVPFAQASRTQKLKTLNDMIREELFVQRGLELGMPGSDPDTRNALVAAVEQQVVEDITSQNPTDAELHAYFDAHRARYADEGRMTVTDYVSPAPAAVRAAAAEIGSGAPAPAAAARHGLEDSGKTSGEEFYFAARLHLGPALFQAAEALKSGQASPPLVQADGTHLLVMTSNKPPLPQDFAVARPKVLNDFKTDGERRLQAADETYLRGKADILIDKAYRP
ncbi:MAG: peptidyl-prolyl cis-trans isomerase [Caulobacteraceae bacterium]